MSLKDELEQLKLASQEKIPKHVRIKMQAATEQLIRSGLAENSLNVGDTVPSFILPNIQGRRVSSEALLKNGPLVISFYRGGWCPYCNLELHALQRSFPQLKDIGAQLVAISPQVPGKAIEMAVKHEVSFEMLSDAGNEVARKFGLVFSLPEDVRQIYRDLGIDLSDYNGNENWEIPIPATYVLDTDGTIVHAYIDPDYTHRLEPSEIIKAIKEMVFLTMKKK